MMPTTIIETRNTMASIAISPAVPPSVKNGWAGASQPSHGTRSMSAGAREERHHAETHERAHHEQLRVSEVDHEQDAVDQRVPEGDQRVHAAQGDAVDELRDDEV